MSLGLTYQWGVPNTISGYDYGSNRVPRSPVSLQDLRQLEETTGFTEEDRRYLALAGHVLSEQAEDMVDAWRAKIGAQEHLAKWFNGPDGQPDDHYKSAVKPRFVQWVIDTCTRPYDQAWLDYQEKSACAIRRKRRTRPITRIPRPLSRYGFYPALHP